jgi:DnaJ-class molecular chaperone
LAIFKKVADVARSNLEALKENLGKGLDEYSDEELLAELERRRLERADQKAAPVASASPAADRPPADELTKAYASLEIGRDADLEAVKAQYRKLIRRYHPDRHADDPEKHALAVELAQKLTKAYMKVRAHLEKA